MNCCMLWCIDVNKCALHLSDSLVEEAAGGRTNVLSIIEKDEEGYRTSEVTCFL